MIIYISEHIIHMHTNPWHAHTNSCCGLVTTQTRINSVLKHPTVCVVLFWSALLFAPGQAEPAKRPARLAIQRRSTRSTTTFAAPNDRTCPFRPLRTRRVKLPERARRGCFGTLIWRGLPPARVRVVMMSPAQSLRYGVLSWREPSRSFWWPQKYISDPVSILTIVVVCFFVFFSCSLFVLVETYQALHNGQN